MTYEDKMEAMQALGNISIHMRSKSNWYIQQISVKLRRGDFLHYTTGEGKSPQEAVSAHWEILTTLVDADGDLYDHIQIGDRKLKWNSFMWQDV